MDGNKYVMMCFEGQKIWCYLCEFIGNEIEVLFLFINFVISSLYGFMSPEKRSMMLNILIFLFGIMGSLAGFVSAHIYKLNSGRN